MYETVPLKRLCGPNPKQRKSNDEVTFPGFSSPLSYFRVVFSLLCGRWIGPESHFWITCSELCIFQVSGAVGSLLAPHNRERKISPKFFRPKFFSWTSARHVRAKMLGFPGLGGPDRSFWPDVRRDVRPKTSSLGWFFLSDTKLGSQILRDTPELWHWRPQALGRQLNNSKKAHKWNGCPRKENWWPRKGNWPLFFFCRTPLIATVPHCGFHCQGSRAKKEPKSRTLARAKYVGFFFRENQTCTKSWLPFCVAFAPLLPKENWPFSGTGKHPLSVGSPSISTGSPVWIHCFLLPGNRGQKWSTCLILHESYPAPQRVPNVETLHQRVTVKFRTPPRTESIFCVFSQKERNFLD